MSGFSTEAAPLLRSLLEHALAIAWLVDSPPEAALSLLRAQRQAFERLRQAMSSGNWTVTAEDFERALGDPLPTSSQDHMLHTINRLRRYGSKSLEVGWLFDSQYSHPTLFTAGSYVDTNDGAPTLFSEPKRESVKVALMVVACLLFAMHHFNRLLYEEPLTDELEAISQQVQALTNG